MVQRDIQSRPLHGEMAMGTQAEFGLAQPDLVERPLNERTPLVEPLQGACGIERDPAQRAGRTPHAANLDEADAQQSARASAPFPWTEPKPIASLPSAGDASPPAARAFTARAVDGRLEDDDILVGIRPVRWNLCVDGLLGIISSPTDARKTLVKDATMIFAKGKAMGRNSVPGRRLKHLARAIAGNVDLVLRP